MMRIDTTVPPDMTASPAGHPSSIAQLSPHARITVVERAIVDALWCGQGMAHLLRLYANAGTDPATAPADGLALFDVGSGGRALTMAPIRRVRPCATRKAG